MKKTRMEKIFALLFAVIFLLGYCGNDSKSTREVQIKYSVWFGVGGSISSATVDGKAITSPYTVKVGTEIVFTVSPNTNYVVRDWEINGMPQYKHKQTSFVYTVKEADIQGGIIGVVVYFQKEPLPIHFTAQTGGTISATVNHYSISSGNKIGLDSEVVFTAKPYFKKTVKTWKMNGSPISGTEKKLTYKYTVKKSDLSGGAIAFDIVFEDAQQFDLTFTAGTITASREDFYKDELTAGSKIYESEKIYFRIKPPTDNKIEELKLKGNTVLSKWKEDGKENDSNTTSSESNYYLDYAYLVDANDATGNTITLAATYTTRGKKKLYFSGENTTTGKPISVEATSYAKTFTHGSNAWEGQKIDFKATGTILATCDSNIAWMVNNDKKWYATTFTYVILPTDISHSGGYIDVKFTCSTL